MINAHVTDARGVYLRTESVDPMGPQPAWAIYDSEGDVLPDVVPGHTRMRSGGAWLQVPDADVPPMPETPLRPSVVPAEVPRWAGLLSIKRHALAGGELVLLPAEHPGDTSLHAAVQALRASMPPGEARDRLDVALNDVKDWTRYSPTVVSMCQALTLRDDQADALFVWAKAQEATI